MSGPVTQVPSGPGGTRSGPLSGLTVVVTASRRAGEQAAIVSSLGGEPYVVPTVGIALPAGDAEIGSFLARVTSPAGVDYAVFMTATGVRAMVLAAERSGAKGALLSALNAPRTCVVARSGKPRRELVRQGIKVDASPQAKYATALGILRLLEGRVSGKMVAVLWHGSRNGAISAGLLAAGARDVLECLAYRYSRELLDEGAEVLDSIGFRPSPPRKGDLERLIAEVSDGTRKIDAVTFTSPPAVVNLLEAAAELGLEGSFKKGLKERRIAVAAVGPSTRDELEEYGVGVDVVPGVAAMGAMMSALAEFFSRGGRRVCS